MQHHMIFQKLITPSTCACDRVFQPVTALHGLRTALIRRRKTDIVWWPLAAYGHYSVCVIFMI
jgi:hypothetical protein